MSVNKDPSGNGQWLVSVRYTDFQGKTKQKCKRGFKTKREGLAWEREFLKQSHTDLDMTFGSFVEIYSSDIMPRIKQNTWRTKETIIEKKLLPYFKDRKINEIKAQDIIKWQNAMLKKKGPQGEKLSPTFLKTIHNQLSAIFNHAVRFYELPSNPAQKTGNMGKEKSKEMLFWTKEEYLKFSESMMDKPISYYAFEMLYWCGLRMGELLALGLNVDARTVEIIDKSKLETEVISTKNAKELFEKNIVDEMENAEDLSEIEKGVRTFVEWLKSGKIEMRMYTKDQIHAKLYIVRKDPIKSPDFSGSVITGSSNFSMAGLKNNLEFNVELRDDPDVQFAKDKFEELWKESTDIKDIYIETVTQKTCLREDITPYEIYLKAIYEFFKEEINSDKNGVDESLYPDGYMKLQYQLDAVAQAKKRLETYNGVFIADVVGLGKTYICAMLAKSLPKGRNKLIICPPVLKDYWESVLKEFDVVADADTLEKLMELVDKHYSEKHNYSIFKKNTSLSQLLQQGECDVLGISIQPDETTYYAVDVAFHEAGLNYGNRDITVMKVLEKCARTAFCLHGYLSTKEAEIIFASPKINLSVLSDLIPCVEELNLLFANNGYDFTFRVIANEEYNDLVLKPILLVSDGVADTSELFLRSYQMYKMFSDVRTTARTIRNTTSTLKLEHLEYDYTDADVYQELKIGQLAQKVLGRMLCDGCASDEEIVAMQTAEYSKQHFDLQYPLLKLATEAETPLHYYAKPIEINGTRYRMCCEWFEKKGANNDRPYLLKWIESHKKQ